MPARRRKGSDMPIYKDTERNTWYCKTNYTDWQGASRQKIKRGFQRKEDAKRWERDFLQKIAPSPDMTFSALADLYLEDVKINRKAVTYRTRESRIRIWITPYFGKMKLGEITPSKVRAWENMLKGSKSVKGTPLSLDYMDNLVVQLSNVFNYAVRFHGLARNPVTIAGNTVGRKTCSLNFWTKDQFDAFLATFDAADPYVCLFSVLYYAGLRKGELQALMYKDVDLTQGVIRVSKTFHIIHGEEVITEPKTDKANRTVTIPPFLCDLIREYEKRIYKPAPEDRVFFQSASHMERIFKEHTEAAGLPKIRLHDLRHSHVSLLIDLGFSALLVSERMGHKSVTTTLNRYAHLFPSRQSEVADRLEQLYAGKSAALKQREKDPGK